MENPLRQPSLPPVKSVQRKPGQQSRCGTRCWLTFVPDYEEKDGIWYTTFVFKSTDATGKQPVNVTFINDAASYDPDLWTTLTFYGPLAAPSRKRWQTDTVPETRWISQRLPPRCISSITALSSGSHVYEGVTDGSPCRIQREAGETNGYTTVYTVKDSIKYQNW